MSIKINEDFMSLEISGAEITAAEITAAVRLYHLWRVTGWPGLLTRNEAITALMLTERLAPGQGRRGAVLPCAGTPAGCHRGASRGLGRIPGGLASPRPGSSWDALSRRSSSRSRRL